MIERADLKSTSKPWFASVDRCDLVPALAPQDGVSPTGRRFTAPSRYLYLRTGNQVGSVSTVSYRLTACVSSLRPLRSQEEGQKAEYCWEHSAH